MQSPSVPPRRRSFWQWYRAQTRFARIGLGCASIFVVLMLCTCTLAAYGSTLPRPKTTQSPTSTPTKALTQAIVLATVPTTPPTPSPTARPTPTRTPTATPTMKPTPTPKPTATPVLKPGVRTTPTPKPQPTPTHCVGINNNPWCYDFNPGSLIYTPPNGFCNYFNCIATFYQSDKQPPKVQQATAQQAALAIG